MAVGRPAIIESGPVLLTETELLARLFRALGDATRLRIVELLIKEPDLHQAEIVRRLGVSQARASEHLACLVWCGFVESSTDGRRTIYRVANRQVPALVERARRFLDQDEAQIASCRRIDERRGVIAR